MIFRIEAECVRSNGIAGPETQPRENKSRAHLQEILNDLAANMEINAQELTAQIDQLKPQTQNDLENQNEI